MLKLKINEIDIEVEEGYIAEEFSALTELSPLGLPIDLLSGYENTGYEKEKQT